jgi:hypothetical protein
MPVGTLKIVYRDPRSLRGYPRNSRKHTPDQIAAIGRSIREFGFTNPVLLKDDAVTIGAGHARTEAAIAENLASVPTILLKGLSDAQWRAYVIADNALAEKGASWSPEMLKLEFGELRALDFDLTLTGFSIGEIEGAIFGPNDPNAEWGGMPEFEQNRNAGFRTIIVHFGDQNAVDEFCRRLEISLGAKVTFMHYPERAPAIVADKRYASS